MFNSQNNYKKEQNTPKPTTAVRTNSGGSMSQNIMHPQEKSGTDFFHTAPSLGDICVPEKEIREEKVREPISSENESGFFRPAEIFINSADISSKDDTVSQDGNIREYANFKKQRLQLADILNHASLITNDLNMEKFTDNLKTLKNRIESHDFKIQIVGTFKNGKSTFINSFLGEDVLPAYALPCTAVINEVKYGEKKRAVLHFKNPIPDTLPKELSKEALLHMKKHNMKNIPPMEIPYDDIESFVVIPMGKDPKEMLLESPYERVELFWPMELLKNGIEIIDSPGLNEHATRTKVTMGYISKADAVIFVLNATALCSMEEMNFIENNLKAQGFSDLFFVVNRFDMIPEKERDRIKRFALKKLGNLTTFGENGIFFVSAKNALDAKKESDGKKLCDSGMPDFEKSLSEFLTHNRGSSKLYLTSQKLRKLLTDEIMGKIIPRRRAMLETSMDELNAKYQSIIPKLKLLATKKEILHKNILYSISQHEADFKQMAQKNISAIIEAVPGWVNEFTPVTKLGVIPSTSKATEILNEISVFLGQKLEAANKKWQKKTLFPVMKEKGSLIFESAEKEIRIIAEEISSTASVIPGAKISEDLQKEISDLNPSSIDYDKLQISRDISARITGETVLVVLSFINPAALLGLFAVKLAGSDSGILKKLKETVINEVTKTLSDNTYEFVDSVSDNVSKYYTTIAEKMLEPINYEITEMQNQMESAISDIEKGEESTKQKKAVLNGNEIKLKSLCIALENFAMSIKTKKL